MFSARKTQLLRVLVREYIATAVPVASENLVRKYDMRVSPATIRNELARLEDEGFIIRPHHSAGAIPSDSGYRYYVELLLEPEELPLTEQRLIRHLFYQVERELEEWNRLAAYLLARLVQNVAIVTRLKTAEPTLKHLELVALQDFLAMLVVMLKEVRLCQQIVTFEQAVSQEELNALADKLNALYSGLTAEQILSQSRGSTSMEQQVTKALVRIIQTEQEATFAEPYLEGLSQMLSQPEFTKKQEILTLIGLLEEKRLLGKFLSQVPLGEGVQVIIGKENRDEAMQGCSLVLTKYGIPHKAGGIIGVVGPTRMPYERAISSVRYLSALLSAMTAGLYHGEDLYSSPDGVN